MDDSITPEIKEARDFAAKALREWFYPALEKVFVDYFEIHPAYNGGHIASYIRMEDTVKEYRKAISKRHRPKDQILLEISLHAARSWLGMNRLLTEAPAAAIDSRLSEINDEIADLRLYFDYLAALNAELREQRRNANRETSRIRKVGNGNFNTRRPEYMERKIRAAFGNGGVGRITKKDAFPKEGDSN